MSMRSSARFGLCAVGAALFFAAATGAAVAQSAVTPPRISDGVVKIGLVLDLWGPYSDNTGEGSALAARMAVEDFGSKTLGVPIEVVVADHRNSSDRAGTIARDWFDTQHVDAI